MRTVTQAIATAVSNSPEGKERIKALKAVRFVLRSGSMFVGPIAPGTLESTLVTDKANALRFDGRDNEEMKARFFSALFSAPFTAELV